MGRPPFRRAAAVLAAALLVAACGDDTTTTTADTVAEQAAPAEMAETTDGGHSHGEGIEVGDADEIPTVSITAMPDAKSGINLQVQTTGIAFAPEHASSEHVLGEGHAHVYVDGEKYGRLYGMWMHLDVEAGEHEIRVDLNANDHSPLLVDGEPVDDVVTVEAPEPPSGHGHAEGFEADAPHPTVALTVTEDPKSGWNVQVETADYTFAPEKASTMETTSGEGHAHLYVDGRKIARMYGEWLHVDEDLAPGDHEFRVELSANDHSPYLADGAPIEAVQTVTVAGVLEDAPSADDADQVIEVEIAGDSVDNGGRHEVSVGGTVALVITSDVDDQIHVHGYDLYADIGPSGPATVLVEATIPGVWEVELHDSGLFLLELAVS